MTFLSPPSFLYVSPVNCEVSLHTTTTTNKYARADIMHPQTALPPPNQLSPIRYCCLRAQTFAGADQAPCFVVVLSGYRIQISRPSPPWPRFVSKEEEERSRSRWRIEDRIWTEAKIVSHTNTSFPFMSCSSRSVSFVVLSSFQRGFLPF